jgi:hypothetical protein
MAVIEVTEATPSRRVAGWRVILVCLLAGALWGVVARVWMRIISSHPEFSWSGTLFIVMVFAVSGLLWGASEVARRGGGGRARVAAMLGVLSVLPIGFDQGVVMLPAIVFGAFSLPGTRPPLAKRIGLGGLMLPVLGIFALGLDVVSPWFVAVGLLMAAGIVVWPVAGLVALLGAGAVTAGFFTGPLAPWRAVLGVVVYLALLAPMAVAYARTLRGVPVVGPAAD